MISGCFPLKYLLGVEALLVTLWWAYGRRSPGFAYSHISGASSFPRQQEAVKLDSAVPFLVDLLGHFKRDWDTRFSADYCTEPGSRTVLFLPQVSAMIGYAKL